MEFFFSFIPHYTQRLNNKQISSEIWNVISNYYCYIDRLRIITDDSFRWNCVVLAIKTDQIYENETPPMKLTYIHKKRRRKKTEQFENGQCDVPSMKANLKILFCERNLWTWFYHFLNIFTQNDEFYIFHWSKFQQNTIDTHKKEKENYNNTAYKHSSYKQYETQSKTEAFLSLTFPKFVCTIYVFSLSLHTLILNWRRSRFVVLVSLLLLLVLLLLLRLPSPPHQQMCA